LSFDLLRESALLSAKISGKHLVICFDVPENGNNNFFYNLSLNEE